MSTVRHEHIRTQFQLIQIQQKYRAEFEYFIPSIEEFIPPTSPLPTYPCVRHIIANTAYSIYEHDGPDTGFVLRNSPRVNYLSNIFYYTTRVLGNLTEAASPYSAYVFKQFIVLQRTWYQPEDIALSLLYAVESSGLVYPHPYEQLSDLPPCLEMYL